MRVQIKIKKIILALCLTIMLFAGVVGYLIATFEPGMTLYVENKTNRASLEKCLYLAKVKFITTAKNEFKAVNDPDSIMKMNIIWDTFLNEKLTDNFCKELAFEQKITK